MNKIPKYNIFKKKYEKNGWVLVKKIFSKREVSEINNVIDSFLKKSVKKYKGKNINFTSNRLNIKNDIENINSFHSLSDSSYIKNKSKNKKIATIVKNLLSAKPKYMASELFAKPAGKGLPSPIHQDNYYWCVKGGNALTVWVALDYASSENGGLSYYNCTHKLGVVKHEPSFARGSSQKVSNIAKYKKYKQTCPKLTPGDALFHHSEIMHGSSANKSGKRRRGLTFQFKDYNAQYDRSLKKKYLESLNKQIILRDIRDKRKSI
jgi:phytanoyl-CoA hydroxylase